MYDGCMLGKVLALSTLCAAVLLSALMQSTTPSSIHPMGLLAVFFLLYVLALGMLTFFIYALGKILMSIRRSSPIKWTVRRAYTFATVIAFIPVMMVGMLSIGRLNVYDMILILTFGGISCFYVARQR